MKSKLGLALFSGLHVGSIFLAGMMSTAKADTLVYSSLSDWETTAISWTETTSYGIASPLTPITTVGLKDGPSISGDTVIPLSVADWGAWCCNYSDPAQVLWRRGSNTYSGSLTSSVNGLGMFIEPFAPGPFTITLSLSDTSFISQTVDGDGPALFFGWIGQGITSFTVSTNSDPEGFAIGDIFATGAAPVPAPIVGSGLPALVGTNAALFIWWRRRRKTQMRD